MADDGEGSGLGGGCWEFCGDNNKPIDPLFVCSKAVIGNTSMPMAPFTGLSG